MIGKEAFDRKLEERLGPTNSRSLGQDLVARALTAAATLVVYAEHFGERYCSRCWDPTIRQPDFSKFPENHRRVIFASSDGDIEDLVYRAGGGGYCPTCPDSHYSTARELIRLI